MLSLTCKISTKSGNIRKDGHHDERRSIAVIDAPSAYAGLKDVAKDYLASVGKADEKAKAEKLIAALNECVESIDDVLPFFASDKAKELFGEEQAAAMLKKGQEVKAAGGDTCFCPACTNGKFVLDHRDLLLG